MSSDSLPGERAIIERILQRRTLDAPRISADKMKVFKAKIGEEIERTGALSEEFVRRLLKRGL